MVGRPVTIVVSDLKGSTRLAERFDSETLRAVLGRYFDEMAIIFESHGGVVAKIVGDAIVTVFDGADDPTRAARRAVRGAVDAQTALTWLNDRFDATWGVRLQNRTGVASGDLPTVRLEDWHEDDDVLTGAVLARAEALEAGAPTMEALIDRGTMALVGTAAAVEPVAPVPGNDEMGLIDAWRLIAVRAPRDDAGPERPEGAARLCGGCGAANDHDARWCTACGGVLATDDVARESRRMVTILFADPRAAAIDGGQATADGARAGMARYFMVMRPILERHGATVEKFIGDALMAVFGLPARHEDDALRAVRAAHEMRTALEDLSTELADRFGITLAQPIGVNTGTVVAGDAVEGQRLVTGDAVNVAARLEQSAGPHDIVIGELTRRLAGDLVDAEALDPLPLKGKTELVPAYRVIAVRSAASGPRHDLPLVGRDEDLAELRRVLRAAIREQRTRRVTVIGDAGVGKSRLIHEVVSEARRTARVLQGRCLAYGDGITFWALLEIVHEVAGIVEGDDADTARRRLAALVGDQPDILSRLESIAGLVDVPYAVAELVWATRWLVERLAADDPVVLVVDDIHWAEPTFIEVLDRLSASIDGPVVILCSARPMALEEHGDFVDAAPSVALSPLTDAQCERFLRLLLGDTVVAADVVRRISGAVGGNPLFLEQYLSMLIDDGRLRHDGSGWHATGDLATLEVPASIQALLAARLDRLPHDERQISGSSSVIGYEFAADAVTALVDGPLQTRVPEALAALVVRDLVEVTGEPDATYRFQHQLIRDATYEGLLKQSRAVLHERFVRWLDTRDETRDRAMELREIQGYHLEQAYRYWRELGRADQHVIDMGLDAAHRLRSAGERALARGDMPAAASLLLRAADLIPDGHDAKPRTLLLAGSALDEAGWFDRAIAAFESSAEAARVAGNEAAVEAAGVARTRLAYLTGRSHDREGIGPRLDETLARLTVLADPDALSRAWQLRLDVDIAACRWAAAQHAAGRVIRHARQAGNAILELRTMRLLAFLAQKGPMPVAEATAVCHEILDQVASDRRSAAVTRLDLALLTAMALDFDGARRLCTDARHTLGELGADTQAALVSLSAGPIELLAGQPARAEAQLREDYEALQQMGERNFVALTAALLADAVYRQRRFNEARDLIDRSRELAAPDDLAVRIVAGSVDGKLTARAGDPSAGVGMLQRAVRLIEATEDPSGQADTWLDLAEVLHLAGRHDRAVVAAAQAHQRYVEKGNRAGIRRADLIGRRLHAREDPLDDPLARATRPTV